MMRFDDASLPSGARLFPEPQDFIRASRQIVDPPSQDEMEDDQGENGDYSDWRGRIDQNDNGRYDPKPSEDHTQPAKALAKGRVSQHGYAKSQETCRHDGKPGEE